MIFAKHIHIICDGENCINEIIVNIPAGLTNILNAKNIKAAIEGNNWIMQDGKDYCRYCKDKYKKNKGVI